MKHNAESESGGLIRARIFVVVAALSVLASGCATPALVKHTRARTWKSKATPDQFLSVTVTGRTEVVVLFRQSTWVDEKEKLRLVAWRLDHSPDNLIIGARALKQFTNACERVQKIGTYSPAEVAAGEMYTVPGYVILDKERGKFTVVHKNAPCEPLGLPFSSQSSRPCMRWALMPLAIVADAVIIAICSGAGGYKP